MYEKINLRGHSLDARVQSAVDGTVEEQEALHDGDVVVEVRGMGLELFVVVGGEEAPGPPAVIVQRHPFAGVLAQVVGTPVPVLFETVLFLSITDKRFGSNEEFLHKATSIKHIETFFGFYEQKKKFVSDQMHAWPGTRHRNRVVRSNRNNTIILRFKSDKKKIDFHKLQAPITYAYTIDRW